MNYRQFLESKKVIAPESGMIVTPDEINPALKPHQRDSVMWALKGGRRALFQAFGLGKTVQQLEFCRIAAARTGGKALIVMPLGVMQEFRSDAVNLLGWETAPPYVTTLDEAMSSDSQIVLTNYERVRDGDIDPKQFSVTSLDEAAVLRSYGSKTYQEFLNKFAGVPYKLVATATPSPNRFKELVHYAGYLEVMDTGQALTRFFQRDSTKANNLTLYPHKEEEFWLWVASWALFISTPSDLGYDDTGYALPPMEIRYHKLDVDNAGAGVDRDGQMYMLRDAARSLRDEAREKRESIDARIQEAKRIIAENPDDHYIIWHDLEAERKAIKKAIPQAVDIYGSLDLETREKRTIDFAEGRTQIFSTKKSISGCGCNFQRHCHRAIFLGIDYKFHDFIQAVHRIYRFLQSEQVTIDIIYMESESEILAELKRKWSDYDRLTENMQRIVKTYGLNDAGIAQKMERSIGVKRVEHSGRYYTAINNDCIVETERMESDSCDLILTSIPFSNHYEYTPSYNDLGHNENTERFFDQMDYLSPNLLRVLKPGRVFACHVKDRILFGNATGTGMPTVEPFHADCIHHYMRHGFQFMGMITVVTDVVRENNQTYRLGWTEQCKDGSKMGVGCPEYVLLFRKLPSDTSTAYADVPVTKTKREYTRARWQVDAHAFWRSSGDRLLTKEEIRSMPVKDLAACYHKFSRETVYSYEQHIKAMEDIDEAGRLPATFMLLDPGSWTPDVWDDIARMKTLNTTQSKKRKQLHVCLAEGTLVLTRNGYTPIEDVQIGDMCLTHEGRWRPIVAKACTGIKETAQMKARGVPYLVTTPDHKIWCRKTDKRRQMDYMPKTDPQWIEAQDTVGGFVNLKLPPIEESPLTEKDWWLVGRYLADGHKGTRGDYFISVGKAKQEEFERMAEGVYGSYADRTALQYRLLSNAMSDELKSTLDKCGRGAENKQVPIEGLCLDPAKAESLLSGYLSGDGSTTGNAISASSVSRALLLGMAMVAQRARGVVPSIFAGKRAGKHTIEGREVNQLQEWVMSWRDATKSGTRILEDGAWKRVRESVPTGQKTVWSIEVEEDHSFTAEGCIVKNCPLQIDIVDRLINRYSNPDETVLDPFGGIMTVPYRAVSLGRRGIGIELNADYYRDGLGYLREADNQQCAPTLFDVMGVSMGA